jgi:hypothetical protein
MKIRKAKPEDLDFIVKLLKDNDLCYEDIASKIVRMFLGHAGDGIIGIGGIGLVIFTIMVWKNQSWSLAGKLYYSLITISCISFMLFLNYWNLLGFRY